MELLQMGAQDLTEYIENIVLENPILELQEQFDSQDITADFARRLEWLNSNDLQNRDYYSGDLEAHMDFLANCVAINQPKSLYDHVRVQIETLNLPPLVANCAIFLAGCLNRNGWIDENLLHLAEELNISEDVMEQALTALQSVEPAGIGARNLSECLCLQLLRQAPIDKLAIRIVERHLEDLAQNHYHLIARTMNIDQNAVRQACRHIRTLDPRPGSKFAPDENPGYITPDVIVVNVENHFECLTNERLQPKLSISSYYRKLLQNSDDLQVKDYLTHKIRQAKWMVSTIEYRKDMILACAECIVEKQNDFFRDGPGHLKPLSLDDVAQQVGVHKSTVSRAINQKYLQCSLGCFSLSYFFPRCLGPSRGKNASSTDTAKTLLKSLIDQEDKHSPLSDEKLCQRMAELGCVASRRTVAKYREILGIPNATGRKS